MGQATEIKGMFSAFDNCDGGFIADGYVPPNEKNFGVKSALRVIDVFEFIEHVGAPVRAMDISQSLGMPNSSTSELLKTLVQRGYLAFDEATKYYSASPRLGMLCKTVDDAFFGGRWIYEAIREIRDTTGETAALFIQNGDYMQFVASAPGLGFRPARHCNGTRVNMLFSACGRALLALKSEKQATSLLFGALRWTSVAVRPKLVKAALDDLRIVRTQGYAVASPKLHPPGKTAVAIKVPATNEQFPVILGVGNHSLGEEFEVVATANKVIEKYLH